jgi:hypothetical protein
VTPEEFSLLDAGKSKGTKFAHEFIFHELGIDAPDFQGRLLRSNDLASARWQQWQKSVQDASRKGSILPEVMAYFQATKHLVKPPQAGDVNIMQTGKLDSSLLPPAGTAPRFTWSPSKLMSFETCPAKFAAESYYKTVPYTESVQSIWGTRVHKTAEDFMAGIEVTDLEAFEMVKPFVKLLDTLPGERLIEYKIALDENWKPCEWADGTARMILDLGLKDGKLLRAYDYKTGKMKDDPIQMQIYAYALAILFPDVETFDFRYIWLKDKKTTGFKLERREILPVAKDVRQRVRRMKEAWDAENFPMRKNGLCKQWCGHVGCPYSGKGR